MSIFLQLPPTRILYQDELFFIIRDGFPVSPGHLLIISNAVRADYFALTQEEQQHLPLVLAKAKQFVEQDFQPDGYNLGMNCGPAAGQTVPHFHCHLIPRYAGDMTDPRGGVRHCIAGKGYY
ncbi:HIT family protein [Hymenobacter canadensis]|uniref:HIT family protein n=1 Tax=Hymenobacter canadensis TaxID=2999067 RepID=A0ABY7LXM1_9BACT|nr:HIT family protein [Hymenobacter canadensis]WBA44334.1 HIT family protein [Hymenobacter canadensis]